VPVRKFYELRISLGDGNAVVAVMAKSALRSRAKGPSHEGQNPHLPRMPRRSVKAIDSKSRTIVATDVDLAAVRFSG
jgi:hypothetical protein